jgi:hypothetical protein
LAIASLVLAILLLAGGGAFLVLGGAMSPERASPAPVTEAPTPASTTPPSAAVIPNTPQISQICVTWVTTDASPLIRILGTGLGSHPAYDGDTSLLEVSDTSRSWNAGYQDATGQDAVTLNVDNWSDTLISARYSGYYAQDGWTALSGDTMQIQVWNPQSGAGPVTQEFVMPSTSSCTAGTSARASTTVGNSGSGAVLPPSSGASQTLGPWTIRPLSVTRTSQAASGDPAIPAGFVRLQVAVELTASDFTSASGIDLGGAVAASPVMAVARSESGFTYGWAGESAPVAGYFGEFCHGCIGLSSDAFVPPGASLPYYIELDVPVGAGGLEILLGVGDPGNSYSNMLTVPPPLDFPLSAFAPLSTAESATYLVPGTKRLGSELSQGPLAYAPTGATLAGPCSAANGDNTWELNVTIREHNSYGYALVHQDAVGEIFDSRGHIWDSVANTSADVGGFAGTPPDSTVTGEVPFIVADVMMSCKGNPRPAPGHMYLLLALPELTYGQFNSAQTLGDAEWGFYDLGIPPVR